MPIAVVGGSFLRVAQHFIGFIDFNKAGLRSLFFIGIRVILLGKTTKLLFQFLVARITRYAQYLIIITFVIGHQMVLYLPSETGRGVICSPYFKTDYTM